MAETWPVDLPQKFEVDGYEEVEPDNVIRSQTSIGPGIVRRRTTANVVEITGTMFMSSAQKTSFKTFYGVTTLSGTLVVTFPDPNGGSPLTVRIVGRPTYAAAGGDYWRVSLKIEVLP